MKEIKETFLPNQFKIINEIIYYRLEDGKVAIEKPEKVIIESSKEDVVELITLEEDSKVAVENPEEVTTIEFSKEDVVALEKDSKKVRFWKINGKVLYSLAKPTYVKVPITIPEDTIFAECYYSESYKEGQYIKYKSSGRCGIMYVSETEVSNVISYEKGYVEICFENNLFYADSGEGENRYHVINEAGNLLGEFPSKCKRLGDYMLFYDESCIFIGESKFEIPGGVSSVEVRNTKLDKFIIVINSNGIYYYTSGMQYLLGPIQRDAIKGIDQNKCLVYGLEKDTVKIIQMFYIKITKDAYVCKKLSSNKGIDPIYLKESNGSFFVADKVLYELKDDDFLALIKGIDATQYKITAEEVRRGWIYTIVGYKGKSPVYIANYDKEKVYNECTLEKIGDGYRNYFKEVSHICKESRGEKFSNDYIYVIGPNGNVVFGTAGNNCYKKKYKDNDIYVVEQSENNIALYTKNGNKI